MTFYPVATVDPSLLKEGSLTSILLHGIHYLDAALGMPTWDSRYVALSTVVLLGAWWVWSSVHDEKKYGVKWSSLGHAIVSGGLSFICVWVAFFGAETLTGTTEPLRSFQCQGPLTSIHRILPAITMGFGIIDICEGLTLSFDFLMHGLATFTFMAYVCEFGVQHIVASMLLMEISTIPLSFVRATFLSEQGLVLNMAAFVLSFFVVRIFICPYLMYEIVRDAWSLRNDPESQACIPWHFKYVCLVAATVFNSLNFFWAYKLIKKVQRKFSGKEKVTAQNDLLEKGSEVKKTN